MQMCFVHPIFRFWFLVTFVDKVMKILRNLCLHFARQDGQDRKKWKENHATKVTKIPKTKRRKYGMNISIQFICIGCNKIFSTFGKTFKDIQTQKLFSIFSWLNLGQLLLPEILINFYFVNTQQSHLNEFQRNLECLSRKSFLV